MKILFERIKDKNKSKFDIFPYAGVVNFIENWPNFEVLSNYSKFCYRGERVSKKDFTIQSTLSKHYLKELKTKNEV